MATDFPPIYVGQVYAWSCCRDDQPDALFADREFEVVGFDGDMILMKIDWETDGLQGVTRVPASLVLSKTWRLVAHRAGLN